MSERQRSARRTVGVARRAWRTPELDVAAADALAVATLYVSGAPADAELAGHLLDELTLDEDSAARIIGGLVSVCATTLVLLEFHTGIEPARALSRVGELIAQATLDAPR